MIIMNLNFQISEIYYDLVKAFNFSEANRLVSHCENNLEINLKSDIKLFFELIYKFLKNKHEFFCEYLNNSLVSEFIQSL